MTARACTSPDDRAHQNEAERRRAEGGAALAELALVVPVMLILLLVVFDLGRGSLAHISIKEGARDGARAALAASIEAGVDDCTDDSTVLASGHTVSSLIESFAKSSATGSSFIDATDVSVVSAYDSVAGRCHVTVSWNYVPIIPFVTSTWSLPVIGTVGPFWDGSLSDTATVATS